jgi:3-methyladenine DNA glycosylase AlkD
MPVSAVADIDAALRPHILPGRADQERAYLKSARVHLGVAVPQVRAVARAWAKAHRPDAAAALDLADALWATGVYEHASAGLEVLRTVRLGPDALPRLERLLRLAETWALVDVLAPELVGPLLLRHPTERPVLERWAADPDPWVRRASLLAELLELRKGRGDWDAWARRADGLVGDGTFWVQKAIGWVLRTVAERDPARVIVWVGPRAAHLSTVTFREATRKLPEADREALEATRSAEAAGVRAAGPAGRRARA